MFLIHKRKPIVNSFERLDMLWERYPQYRERTVFSTMEELLAEHESWQKDFEDIREEYESGQYDRFLIRLSWSDLPYRYATKLLIEEAPALPENPYVEAFMEQFRDIDTDHKACFLFPESFISQLYKNSVYPVSQSGASGLAFEAGVRGRNLTEWQYGLASVNPRWNVSGAYMQVLPRVISTEADGTDEREFLLDF